MDGEKRRETMMELLRTSKEPLSGAVFSKRLGVSRQVIVQDIALLRATNKNILSTNKGYILFEEKEQKTCKRILMVKHSDAQMRKELYQIVDAGANVLDVIVEHEVYGQIAADLYITSRKDVDEFMEKILSETAKPLKELTGNVHYHTIAAEKEEILDAAAEGLRQEGILIDSE